MERLEPAKLRATLQPPWDELREQRVLRRAMKMRTTRATARTMASRVVAALAVAAALVLVARFTMPRGQNGVARLETALPPTWRASVEPSVVTLSEGSRITLPPSARVNVASDRGEAVTVVQTSGRARYDVSKRPERSFVVQVAGISVRVMGTAFEVELEAGTPPTVAVRVERGVVRVHDGRREVELGAGEQLRIQLAGEPTPAAGASVPDVPSVPAPGPSVPAGTASAATAAGEEPATTPRALLARADAARGAGRLDDAVQALEDLLARHPNDPRAASARFTLGKLERQRGDHVKAAGLFHANAAHGPLAEDSLAEEASSWAAAGRTGEARAVAERYLSSFPSGPHAARMQRILE